MVRSALLAVTLFVGTASLSLAPLAQEPLDARLNAALASEVLRQQYFDATGDPPLTVEQAFPHLAGAPLADPSFLDARARTLDAQRTARARERLEAGANERVRAACDAEDAAAALEQHLLVALSVGLEIAPGFSIESIELARQPWRTARERLAAMGEEDPGFAEARIDALEASEAERRLLVYRAAAIRRMAIPSDRTLDQLVESELARSTELATDINARDRLTRAAPLLGAELSTSLQAALQGAVEPSSTAERVELAAEASAPIAEAPTSAITAIRSATAEIREGELVRHTETVEAIRTHSFRYEELRAELADASTLGVLEESRDPRLRAVSRATVELIHRLRERIERVVNARDEHDTEKREFSRRYTTRGADAPTLAALTTLRAALDDRENDTARDLHELMGLEKRVLELRRAATRWTAEPITSEAFVEEITQELREAPLWLLFEWREDARWLRTVPQRATDIDTISEFLGVSFDLFLLALAWIYVRRQSTGWLRRAIDLTQKKDVSRFGFSTKPRRVADRDLEPVARNATDAIGALVLHNLLLPRSELLALAALVWVGWALLRSIPRAIAMLLPILGRALDPLEAESDPPDDVLALGARTSNWFLRWWIVSNVAAFIAIPLLQADRLQYLVTIASWTIFCLLLVLALFLWSEWIRHFIANLADQSAITVWLSRPTRSRLRRAMLSAIGMVYIVLRLGFWALVDRGWLSRSGANIALSQLNLADASVELLSAEHGEEIRKTETQLIERTKELETLQQAFEGWRREKRRGIVAVIGDHGMGKSVFLRQTSERLARTTPDIEVTELALPVRERSDSVREGLSWLTDAFDIEVPKNADHAALQKAVINHLETLPPRVVLVDDLHFLLRRTVGGFDVLEVARNIIQACANEHFWVLTLHRPAWIYVDDVSSAMKLAYRERIELPPLASEELGNVLIERVRRAGFEPEFRSLLKGQRAHADYETLEHKARALYWRLVSQASLGNPRVIGDFWLASLGQTNGETNGHENHLPVFLFAGHGDDEVESMSDEYLFLLTALVVHDGLKTEDLAEVLNETLARVRVACQNLESLGIVETESHRYLVTTQWQPTIARVLDRRNFAHR